MMELAKLLFMCYLLLLSTYRGLIYRMILKMYHFSHRLTTLLSCRSLKSCLVGDSNSFGPHGLNCDGWSPNDTMVKGIGSHVMCLVFQKNIFSASKVSYGLLSFFTKWLLQWSNVTQDQHQSAISGNHTSTFQWRTCARVEALSLQ